MLVLIIEHNQSNYIFLWLWVLSIIFGIHQNKNLNIMIKFIDVPGENTSEHNPYWPQIPEHPYRILIVEHSESRKTNALLNLIDHQ